MKQNKAEQTARTEKLIELGESVFGQIKPTLFDGEEYDDRINLSDNVTKEIKKKRENISEIDKKKEEIILKIIGQLHNGILIPKSLSFRKGKVYKYQCRYELGVDTIREEVMKHLHEVANKLSKTNLDILEYVLNKKYTNPNPHITNSTRDDNKRQKIYKFPEIKIIEKISPEYRYSSSGERTATKKFNIHFINGVTIEDNGEVNFFYEYKDENGDLKTDFPDLESETFAGLYIKFEEKIKENAKMFIQDLDTEIQNGEKEIAEICEKGQNQLALCELQSVNGVDLK